MSGSKLSKVAVVVVNYRTPDLTIDCLDALAGERAQMPGLRAYVVDGGSGDSSSNQIAQALGQRGWSEWVELLPLQINGGFGWANNQAILKIAALPEPPDYVHLLNPDTRVKPGAVESLYSILENEPQCGAVGSQLLDKAGDGTASTFRFPSISREFLMGLRIAAIARLLGIAPIVVDPQMDNDLGWVTGASLMLRLKSLEQTGLFDPGFFLYFEEVELQHRLRQNGWTVRHAEASRVEHIGGAATGVDDGSASKTRSKPDYWFASRRRCLTLTLGRQKAFAANLAWLAGAILFAIKQLLIGEPRLHPDMRGLLRHGLCPSKADAQAASVRLGDLMGGSPAWMIRP